MKARKLLTPSTLEQLAQLTQLGVPVAKAMRDCRIEDEITRPTVVMLLKVYSTRLSNTVGEYADAEASLFPPWLSKNGAAVQEQPESWNYIGYFPQGYWECKV